jgi:hypothetical protein
MLDGAGQISLTVLSPVALAGLVLMKWAHFLLALFRVLQ